MLRLAFILLVFCGAPGAFAAERFVVKAIEIRGLDRTDPGVVRDQLSFREGELASAEDLDESRRRLKNLQIFRSVELASQPHPGGGEDVVVTLTEKWTTIPIVKFGGGGGITQLALGAYDVNLLGRYLELGGQYERLARENSVVVWFRDPRFLGERLELFVNLWHLTRADLLYQELGKSQEIEGRLLNQRAKAAVSLEKELAPWLKAGVMLDYNVDHCSPNTYVDEETRRRNIRDHVPNTRAFIGGAVLKLGRLDYDGFLVDGARLEYKAQAAREGFGSDTSLTSQELQALAYRSLWGRSTAAVRLGVGASDTRRIQYYYFLGGLDRVRGFQASRFYGKAYWLTNLEYRFPTLESERFVLQNVVFFDAVGVSVDQRDLAREVTAKSLGTGIRVVAPQIYRLTLRLDYARALAGEGAQPISFGVQQFF